VARRKYQSLKAAMSQYPPGAISPAVTDGSGAMLAEIEPGDIGTMLRISTK
jgi:hypothetical protein